LRPVARLDGIVLPQILNSVRGIDMTGVKTLLAGAALCITATAGLAGEPKIYPYNSQENYCPAGLQPITISGVICCGQPTTAHSYQQVMRHPVPKKKVYHKAKVRKHVSYGDCPVGAKGCSW
jgi:hypothetical protein